MPLTRPSASTPTPGLRRRVGLSVIAIVAVVLVALFAFVNLTLSSKLHSDLRTRLIDRAGFATLLDGRVQPQELVNQLTGDGVTAKLVTSIGDLNGTAEPRSGPPPGGRRPPRPPAPTDATIQTQGDLLTVSTQLSGGKLVLSASQRDITATLHRLLILEVVGGLIALALLGAALWATLRLALRPLARMTTLATQIAGGATGRRLRPRQPRTELGRTATAFDAMLDELETAVADARTAELTLRRFLSDASHELRTPVAGVSAAAELLLSADLPRDVREQLASGLVTQSRRIARLVDDLLLSARLAEPGAALNPSLVDLHPIVEAQVAHARLLAPDLDIELLPIPPGLSTTVRADEQRLAQIVANLLDNARHATPPGGRVTIEIGSAGPAITLTVSDTGIGVPPDQRERIFDRFVRLDQRATGTGLGLAISRAVAEAHGGTLRCTEPTPEGGARFVLSLPAFIESTEAKLASLQNA